MALLFRGYNTSEPNDYRLFRPSTNELSFARLFWESSDATFVVAPRLTDEDPATGLPRSIPGGRFARTTCGTSSKEVGGTWVLAWEGTGECGIRNGANNLRGTGGYIEFQRDASASVDVCIYSTSATLRRLWLGEQRHYAARDSVFIKPEWAAMLLGLNATHPRFMQLQNTNTSTVTSWGGRRPDNYFTQSDIIADDSSWGRGASLDFLLKIATETSSESLWLCVPHAVDEGQTYVQWVHEALRFIRDWRHPASGARFSGPIRLQYSNETWNSGLGPQHTYCQTRGVALGVDGSSPFEQGHQFYAVRSEQIFETALAARASLGITNEIIRVLDEQAGVGEYLFRYRTQINPRSATPRNVAADEFSSACYYGHPNFERGDFVTLSGVVGTFQAGELCTNGLGGGDLRQATFRFTESGQHFFELNVSPWTSFGVGQTVTGNVSSATGTVASILANRIGRIQIGGDYNPWLTPTAFVALTDQEIGTQCQRDLDQRVFRPVTTYNEGSFPSAPTMRMGGMLATIQYANVSRGLRVTSYEGGCDHINLPSASEDDARWTAARDRNVVWHRSSIAGALHEQCIQRHVTAGVEGIWLFDDGTGWHGAHGCWSVYEDHRRATGYTEEQRYLATQRAFSGGGPPQINVQYPSAVLAIRATPSSVTVTSSTISVTTTMPTLSISASSSTAVVSNFSVSTTIPRVVVSAQPSDVTVSTIPPIDVWTTQSRLITSAQSASVTLLTPILVTSPSATIYTCAKASTVELRTIGTLNVTAPSAELRTRGLASDATLSGADGVATSKVPHLFLGARLFPQVNALLPAGTFVYQGQALGWFEETEYVRPIRPGDRFAGYAAEEVSGWTTDADGDRVLNTQTLRVSFWQKGSVTLRIAGTAPLVVGANVFALDDKQLTNVDNGSKVGRILAFRGRFATVYFEGVPLRLVHA